MATITVEVLGIPAVQQRLERMMAEVVPLMGIALQQEADAILEASQPLVPVDTGALRASGRTLDVEIHGQVVQSGVFYGGPGEGFERTPSQYALRVHEDLSMRHPHGGQAKFLAQPAFAATAGMAERLADALRIAL